MVLEEADKIDKSTDLMAILKTGFAFGGTTPKVNPYTNLSERFFTYCPKIIVSERSLNQSIAKGVNSRIFSINCFKGSIKHDILEILNPTNTGGPENKRLLQEIMNFRKLLLVYRLMHFKDMIPDLDIGVEGRDRQLVKYCIQLFHGCKCQDEVIKTVQKFLDTKNNKKQASIESVLLPLIDKLIETKKTNQVSSLDFWKAVINEIPGLPDLHKPNEFHTDDYGTLYRTTISGVVCDCFGASIKHGDKGNILVFDRTVIKELVKSDIENDKTRIVVNEIPPGQSVVEEEYEEYEDDEYDEPEGLNSLKASGEGGTPDLEKNDEGAEEQEETESEPLEPNDTYYQFGKKGQWREGIPP